MTSMNAIMAAIIASLLVKNASILLAPSRFDPVCLRQFLTVFSASALLATSAVETSVSNRSAPPSATFLSLTLLPVPRPSASKYPKHETAWFLFLKSQILIEGHVGRAWNILKLDFRMACTEGFRRVSGETSRKCDWRGKWASSSDQLKCDGKCFL